MIPELLLGGLCVFAGVDPVDLIFYFVTFALFVIKSLFYFVFMLKGLLSPRRN